MDLPDFNSELQENIFYTAVTVLLVLVFVGIHNVATPDQPVRVGMVEVSTQCYGIDAGVCLGLQRQSHTTYNYDNYTEAEPGTSNFYRRVESELMARAYDACGGNVTGMEWTSQVEYRNMTASEWMKKPEVTLLPCESTFYRDIQGNP